MDVLRTPDSRFENLEGYPFVANYIDVAASDSPPVRMHFLDEGPDDGPPIVLLHGEPTWSYLYRTMIPPLAEAGNRVLAPDLIGFGRSDKPSRIEDYTYLRHVEWVTAWFERLRLKEVTLFVQDWGSLIGLRIAAEQSDRIARVVVANGFLPAAQRRPSPGFVAWRAFARYSPVLPAGRIVSAGTVRRVPPKQDVSSRGPCISAVGADLTRRSGRAGQSGGLGRLGPVGEALSGHLRSSRPDPGASRPSPDQARPWRGRPTARPHQGEPLHPRGQRTGTGRTRPVLAEGPALTVIGC
jgi:haloalkane dehalogenase